MNDAVRVQVPHSVNQLVEDVPSHLLAEPVRMLDETVELTVFCQLHHIVANFSFALDYSVLGLLFIGFLFLESTFRANKLLLYRLYSTTTRMFG